MTSIIVVSSGYIISLNIQKHIDATIANTVEQQIAKSRATSEQTQKLFREVDSICKTLKAEGSTINCGN